MSRPIAPALDAYEALLVEIGAPVVEQLRPGLSDDAMDALTVPLGLRLPGEARAWSGWHDGTVLDKDGGAPIAPYRPFGSLADMVGAYRDLRALYAEVFGELLRQQWPGAWLPFTGLLNGDLYAFDCADATVSATPIYRIQKDAPARHAELPSLAALIETWTACIRTGAWTIDPETGRWCEDDTKLPTDDLPTRLFR